MKSINIYLIKAFRMNVLKNNILKIKVFFCFFLLNHFLIAQPTIEWEQNYGGTDGERAFSIQVTNDGGYIVAGNSYSQPSGDVGGNNGWVDYWIVKLDVLGNLQWENNYGGSDRDVPRSIQQTTDGGYIVAGGSYSNNGDVSGNNGSSDFWIVKLDVSGNLEWERNYGGSEYDFARSIHQTPDGGYIVAGNAESYNGDVGQNIGGSDYWVVKLDLLGNLEWERSYGGSGFDLAYSIQTTVDGGYIVSGSSSSNSGDVGGNNGQGDYWIIKIDVSGNLEWEKNYGGASSEGGYSVQQTIDGGYILAGPSYTNDSGTGGMYGQNDYWIIKLDELGNLEWDYIYGSTSSELAWFVQQTTDGGYVVAGVAGYDFGIIKLDDTGNLEWESDYGGTGEDIAYSILQTMDDGYIVAGSSGSANGDVGGNNGSSDFWIVKLSPIEEDPCNPSGEEISGSVSAPDPVCDVSGIEIVIMAPDGTSIIAITDANGNFVLPGLYPCGIYSATIITPPMDLPDCYIATGSIGPIQFEVDGEGNDGPNFIANPAIPTLSQWGLIILALLLMIFGTISLAIPIKTGY